MIMVAREDKLYSLINVANNVISLNLVTATCADSGHISSHHHRPNVINIISC